MAVDHNDELRRGEKQEPEVLAETDASAMVTSTSDTDVQNEAPKDNDKDSPNVNADESSMNAQPNAQTDTHEHSSVQEENAGASVAEKTATEQSANDVSKDKTPSQTADEKESGEEGFDAIDRALEGEKQAFSSDSDSSSDSTPESESESDSDSDSSSDSESESASDNDDKNQKDDLSEDEGISGPLRTKNEIAEEPAPTVPSDFRLTEDTPIEYVGELVQIVEKTAVIKAAVSGEYRVLAEGSIFCFENRNLLGVLFETFGRVQEPMYTVKFNTTEETEAIAAYKGQKVFYIVPASSFVLTDAVRQVKGSDASNLHDEEVPEEEQEFSDDEKEAEFKSRKKRAKKKQPQQAKAKQLRSDNDSKRGPAPTDRAASSNDWQPNPRPQLHQQIPQAHQPVHGHQQPVQQYAQPSYGNSGSYPQMQFPQMFAQPFMPWLPPQYSPQQFIYGQNYGGAPSAQLPMPSNTGSLPPPTSSGHLPSRSNGYQPPYQNQNYDDDQHSA